MEISSIELSSVLSRRNTETRSKVIYPHFQKMFIINVCKLFILFKILFLCIVEGRMLRMADAPLTGQAGRQ